MKRNPSMTDEDAHFFELYLAARSFTLNEVQLLEKQIQKDPNNLDLRFQVHAYYSKYEGNVLKHHNADAKLAEQVLWFIGNKPEASGYLGHRIIGCGHSFKPKTFGVLREAWLEQTISNPDDGRILGNAASFIGWNDLETASDLFERAYALQPAEGWFITYCIFLYFDIWLSPNLYKDDVRKKLLDVGARSMRTEKVGAPHIACEHVSDAALDLNRLDIVRECAQKLREMGHPQCVQKSNAYLGLVALRENDRDSAIQLMLELKKGSDPCRTIFQLAQELFDLGERETIMQLIERFSSRVSEPDRDRWVSQLCNNEKPDFKKSRLSKNQK